MTDWEWLSIRIIILGLTVFLWSYITEIQGVLEVFGDHLDTRYTTLNITVWGFRHYVYTCTFTLLTAVQIVKIIKWIDIRSSANGFEIKNRN